MSYHPQMRGHYHGLDDLEAAAMLQRRHAGAGRDDGGGIDFRHDDTGLGIAFGDDAPPGINHHGMPKSVAPVFVTAALRRREYEGAVLDRTGTVKDVPMRLPGLAREGRRNREKHAAGFGERPIKARKPKVVTYRDAEPAPRQFRHDRMFARRIAARFAIGLAVSEIDVEHVNFVVARGDRALWIDQEAAVDGAIGRNL